MVLVVPYHQFHQMDLGDQEPIQAALWDLEVPIHRKVLVVRVVLRVQPVLVDLENLVDQFHPMVLHFQRLPEVQRVLQVREDQQVLFHPMNQKVPVALYRLLPLEDLMALSVQVVPGTLADQMVLLVPVDLDCLCHPWDLTVPVGPGSRLGPWVQEDQDHRLGLCRLLDH